MDAPVLIRVPPQLPEYQFVVPTAPLAVNIVLPPSQTDVSEEIIEVGFWGYQPKRIFGLLDAEVALVTLLEQLFEKFEL
jgi:hypothetical protein